MIAIDQVICPVDLSPASANALRHAAAWSRRYEVPLRVLHVVPNPQVIADGSGQTLVYPSCSLDDVHAMVERFVSTTLSDQPMPSVTVLEGHPVRTILEEAAQWPSGLLIMGTHGWTGIDRVLIGSVTETVAHGLRCPLLVVPPKDTIAPANSVEPKRIVCATDFQASSLAGLALALTLAQQDRSRLDLVTVIDPPYPRDDRTSADRTRPDALRDALRARVTDDVRRSCTVREVVLRGATAESLLTYVNDIDADLVVIGTGDRRHLHALWLGSTTGRLLRSARCPVLIVPAARQPIVTAETGISSTRKGGCHEHTDCCSPGPCAGKGPGETDHECRRAHPESVRVDALVE